MRKRLHNLTNNCIAPNLNTVTRPNGPRVLTDRSPKMKTRLTSTSRVTLGGSAALAALSLLLTGCGGSTGPGEDSSSAP